MSLFLLTLPFAHAAETDWAALDTAFAEEAKRYHAAWTDACDVARLEARIHRLGRDGDALKPRHAALARDHAQLRELLVVQTAAYASATVSEDGAAIRAGIEAFRGGADALSQADHPVRVACRDVQSAIEDAATLPDTHTLAQLATYDGPKIVRALEAEGWALPGGMNSTTLGPHEQMSFGIEREGVALTVHLTRPAAGTGLGAMSPAEIAEKAQKKKLVHRYDAQADTVVVVEPGGGARDADAESFLEGWVAAER
jgi:hypothetical protein